MSDRIVILTLVLNSPNLSGAEYGYARLLRAAPWPRKEEALSADTKGIILSGGPQSIYADGAPYIQDYLLRWAANPRHLLWYAGAHA